MGTVTSMEEHIEKRFAEAMRRDPSLCAIKLDGPERRAMERAVVRRLPPAPLHERVREWLSRVKDVITKDQR